MTVNWIYTAIIRPSLSYGAIIWLNGLKTNQNITDVGSSTVLTWQCTNQNRRYQKLYRGRSTEMRFETQIKSGLNKEDSHFRLFLAPEIEFLGKNIVKKIRDFLAIF